jgi:hypothetical protein
MAQTREEAALLLVLLIVAEVCVSMIANSASVRETNFGHRESVTCIHIHA